MGAVYSMSLPKSLKRTLEAVINDKMDGLEKGGYYSKWMQVGNMSDQWVEDLDMAGPGLASEIDEGAELSTGTITEGLAWRYDARKFGIKLIITDEAIEDSKYEQIISATRRIKRALWKTVEYDSANILGRAWNTTYSFADGQPLFSASHTLPKGGTFSNTLATPMSPSRAALIVVKAELAQMPGLDGLIEPRRMRKIVCPVEQEDVWREITGSRNAPEAGQFNAINVVNQDYNLEETCAIPYWRNTSTNWAVTTDSEHGVKWLWRRRPQSKSWLDNDQGLRKFGISARWARGISDPRCMYGSEA